jgi:hypothetical protein
VHESAIVKITVIAPLPTPGNRRDAAFSSNDFGRYGTAYRLSAVSRSRARHCDGGLPMRDANTRPKWELALKPQAKAMSASADGAQGHAHVPPRGRRLEDDAAAWGPAGLQDGRRGSAARRLQPRGATMTIRKPTDTGISRIVVRARGARVQAAFILFERSYSAFSARVQGAVRTKRPSPPPDRVRGCPSAPRTSGGSHDALSARGLRMRARPGWRRFRPPAASSRSRRRHAPAAQRSAASVPPCDWQCHH